MDATTTTRMTLDDFIRAFADEGPFEIIDGQRIHRMPPLFEHFIVVNTLDLMLKLFCMEHPVGKVLSETAFVLLYDQSEWVKGSRVPDILFVTAERWRAYMKTDPHGKPLVIIPDLVVEVVSSRDSYTDVKRKIEKYLDDGVRLVWVIDPNIQRAEVYRPQGDPQQLGLDDALDGGDILPGFSVTLRDVFREL